MLDGKRITLIISGGIAAYKALDLARRLKERGATVRGVLTKGGAEFITPLSVASLTGDKCYTDLFSLIDEAEMGHIRLSREADVLLVAPASADIMAKMAHGLANDLASTILLATDKPVVLVPAMNVEMWGNKATQRNVDMLKADGVTFIGPVDGEMACGEVGSGRMSEVADIIKGLEDFFAKKLEGLALGGKHIVVTAGPTHEPIDPVRYIANRSSGKQGYAIARALADLGAKVTLVSGPTTLEDPINITVHRVETAREMHTAVMTALPADAAICVAAVADWRTDSAANHKLKKNTRGIPSLSFVENPDILAAVSSLPANKRPSLVVGFAAETENIIDNATQKRARKGCDWIIANDVGKETNIMGGDHNQVHVITEHSVESWPRVDKNSVANKLANKIADALQ
jgi:phosphopantothenoylcysteine decarboxylase / phosphopantothenate---cysteine ligase